MQLTPWKIIFRLLIIGIVLSPLNAYSWYAPNDIKLFAIYETSPITGFLQVPTGGAPISTSPFRPTLDELGLNHVGNNSPFFELGGLAQWQFVCGYASFQFNHTQQTNILKENLQTHYFFIGAGEVIKTQTWFDLSCIGINCKYKINCLNLSLSPGVELSALDFHYQFIQPARVHGRNFYHVTGRASINLDFKINTFFNVNINAASTMPQATDLQIQTITADILITLTKKICCSKLLLGVGYERINFEDKQEMPNHLLIEMAPMLRLGLMIGL